MIKPKKSLGQNFLVDNNIIDKIIQLSDINNNHIVEIGPGTGKLTKKIIEKKPKSLILIEKDQKLVDSLNIELSGHNNIKIFNKDILKFDLEDKMTSDSVIIGNLPYNISSQILAKLIKFNNWLPKYKKLILMFQKEVADRILSKYATSSFGRLTILCNARLKVANSFNVSRNCFYPKPKVESTVLVFTPIVNKDFKVKNINNLEKITHIFFSKKRKMINKAFKSIFSDSVDMSKKMNIDLSLRPNQISDKKYFKITEYFEKNYKS